METIRGIPNTFLYLACIVLSFLFFYAGGTAFDQSPFYGALFIGIAVILFFLSVYFGRRNRITD